MLSTKDVVIAVIAIAALLAVLVVLYVASRRALTRLRQAIDMLLKRLGVLGRVLKPAIRTGGASLLFAPTDTASTDAPSRTERIAAKPRDLRTVIATGGASLLLEPREPEKAEMPTRREVPL